ncbi:MAG: hypothetical protein GWO24_02925, partial [Akkermansiaceae bacterium]|nr:hypothetical protein [Akkermansiaceae bacterium]
GSIGAAGPMPTITGDGLSVGASGVIEQSNDHDVFAVEIADGPVSFMAANDSTDANLD